MPSNVTTTARLGANVISNPRVQRQNQIRRELADLYDEWYALYQMVQTIEFGDPEAPWHIYAAFVRTHPEPEWDWIRLNNFSYGA